MLISRALTLAILALSSASAWAQFARPYAPNLLDRDVNVAHLPRDAARPYSPMLYARAVADDDQENVDRRASEEVPLMAHAYRMLGQSCAHDVDGCGQGLFCSSLDATCKQQRSIDGSCRIDAGCQGDLACVNYKCTVISGKPLEAPVEQIAPTPIKRMQASRVRRSSPSGASGAPVELQSPSPSGSACAPIMLTDEAADARFVKIRKELEELNKQIEHNNQLFAHVLQEHTSEHLRKNTDDDTTDAPSTIREQLEELHQKVKENGHKIAAALKQMKQ